MVALLFISVTGTAQNSSGSEVTNTSAQNTALIIRELSDSLMQDAKTEEEKALTIYTWVAQNIEYDYLGVDNITMGFESSQVVEEALRLRKGVCQHYAELFHALAIESGLRSVVVFGYTRQNGKIDKVPHAWNALMIDSSWYLIDATWGSGYFDGTNYQHEFREKYFMVSPSEMIRSHMPFDPLFQFLRNPVSHENFRKGKPMPGEESIDFKNEVKRYFSLGEEDQVTEAMRRVKEFGIANTMVRGYYTNLNRRHNVHVANQQVDLHNQAIEKFNEVVAGYNVYADQMNARGGRLPKNTDEITQQLEDLEKKALEVEQLFSEIDAPTRLALTLSENQKNLEMLLKQVRKEHERLKLHESRK